MRTWHGLERTGSKIQTFRLVHITTFLIIVPHSSFPFLLSGFVLDSDSFCSRCRPQQHDSQKNISCPLFLVLVLAESEGVEAGRGGVVGHLLVGQDLRVESFEAEILGAVFLEPLAAVLDAALFLAVQLLQRLELHVQLQLKDR